MTAQISVYGQLGEDPQVHTSGKRIAMVTAELAVSLPCNIAKSEYATAWLDVIALGPEAELMAKHQKGDFMSVVGNLQLTRLMREDGTTQSSYQILVDSVISARTSDLGGE